MNNREYVELMIVLGRIHNLRKSEIEDLCKSPVNVKNMYEKLYCTLDNYGLFRNLDERIWGYTAEMAKLCRRHQITDKDFDEFYEKFIQLYEKTYHRDTMMWDGDLRKYIKFVNGSSPLKIDLDDYKVAVGIGHVIIDGKSKGIIYDNTTDGWPGMGFSRDRFFKGVALKNGEYLLGCEYDIKNYDMLWLPKLDKVRYEVIDSMKLEGLSNKEYLDNLRRLGLIRLSIGINLEKYAKLENCNLDIKDIVKEVTSLKDITDTEVIKFLIMIVELAKNQDELDRLTEVIRAIRKNIVIHSSIITVLLRCKSIARDLDSLIKAIRQSLFVSRIKEINGLNKSYVQEFMDDKLVMGEYYRGQRIGECKDDFELIYDGSVRTISFDEPMSKDCLIRILGVNSLRKFNGEED